MLGWVTLDITVITGRVYGNCAPIVTLMKSGTGLTEILKGTLYSWPNGPSFKNSS